MSETNLEVLRSFARFCRLAESEIRHWIAVQAYFDESGHYSDNDFVCLTGYVATDEAWESFNDAWVKCLLKHGIRGIHMKDLMRLQGAYKDKRWSKEHRDDIVSEFISVMVKHTLAAFAVGFDAKYFRSLPPHDRAKVGDPHMFCFQRLMRRITDTMAEAGRISQRRVDTRVSVIFDDHQHYSVECYKHWSSLRTTHPDMKHMIPSIAFADDEVFYPLQGADVLSWLSNQWLRGGRDVDKISRHLRELVQMHEGNAHFAFVDELWDKDELDDRLPGLGNKGG